MVVNGVLRNVTRSEIKNGTIEIPYGVRAIESYAFHDVTDLLTKIDIPETVERINGYAFYGCLKLQEVVLRKGLTLIDKSAFGQCLYFKKLIYVGTRDDFSTIILGGDNNSIEHGKIRFKHKF